MNPNSNQFSFGHLPVLSPPPPHYLKERVLHMGKIVLQLGCYYVCLETKCTNDPSRLAPIESIPCSSETNCSLP
uniref:Ovule protein n=1 Tax=Caenorhabditis tropicalis TaxID=1561998 RepID=A0A1I7TQD2_9PELO